MRMGVTDPRATKCGGSRVELSCFVFMVKIPLIYNKKMCAVQQNGEKMRTYLVTEGPVLSVPTIFITMFKKIR